MISVIIGAYNQRETLALVLKSLQNQSLPSDQYEIIVADSSSTDGTEEMTKDFKVKYLHLPNKGKSFARNQGVMTASGEIILLTDADMVADRRLLESHLAAHQRYPGVCVEGLTLNLKEIIAPEKLNPTLPSVEPYIKQKLQPGQRIKWAYFLSGNLSLRKNDFIRAGKFDEHFSQYGWEDIELGYRLSKMKIPLIYAPAAINYHYHFVTAGDLLKRKYEMGKSAAYFYRKHPDFFIKIFLGLNPLAMGIFHLLHRWPNLLKLIKNRYILEEYQYRLGLTSALSEPE